jgi:branched-chain amino acid transport system permease protein
MPFAMITLGLGELVAAAANLLPKVFGGESGVSIDRTSLGPFLGFTFGPQIQVYYVVAFWCFVSAVILYALTRTPFGLMSRALRENENRVEYLGYRPQTIRFVALCISAFFAGVAGGLSCLEFEIMTGGNLGAELSTSVLLMTHIGGIHIFGGPILGAALIGFMQLTLSDITPGWRLYFGLMFIAVVLFVPEGIAGLLARQGRFLRSGAILRLAPVYGAVVCAAAVFALGASVLIELGYQAGLNASNGSVVSYFHLPLDAHTPWPWLGGLLVAGTGFAALRRLGPRAGAAMLDAERRGAVVGGGR